MFEKRKQRRKKKLMYRKIWSGISVLVDQHITEITAEPRTKSIPLTEAVDELMKRLNEDPDYVILNDALKEVNEVTW